MTANFKYKDNGWKFTDQWGKELLYTGQNSTRVNGVAIGPNIQGKGKVYYVDNAGSDGNDGLTAQAPLKLMTTAIGKCVASNYDTVVVMQESPSTTTTGETYPLVIDKAGVLLTGLYSRGLISDSGFGADAINEDCISVGANYVAVENLYLQVYTGGTTGNVIGNSADTTARYGFVLRNCYVGLQNTALYGFYTGSAADWPYLLIENNIFSCPNASNMTSAIVLFNASFSVIRNNLFHHCSSYALSILATCGNVSVIGNKFNCSADTAGFAIQCAAGSRYNYFDWNSAASKDTASDVALFTDASTAGYNKWANNYSGIVAVLAT